MKTIAIILIYISATVISAQTANVSKATFGRYSDNCIAGRGLCSFESQKTQTGTSSNRLAADTFSVRIAKNTLTEADQINIAGKPFREFAPGEKLLFKQIDTLPISQETIRIMRLDPSKFHLAPGTYPIVLTADYVEITFTLCNGKN